MKTNRYRILVLDDETTILDLFRKILCPAEGSYASTSQLSFDLTLCGQAEEAVEAVRVSVEEDRPFAMAFVDIRLPPGPDGIWAAKQIRKLDPNMEIALVTGHLGTDLADIQRRIPPPEKLLYLEKPFDSKEILQLAPAMCTKWQTEKELTKVRAELDTKADEHTSALLQANKQLELETEKRVSAYETLRRSEENFRNMIISNADGIIISDENGIVRFMNPAAVSLFDRKAETLVGRSFGYALVAGETTELDVIRGDGTFVIAEMRVVKTVWEAEMAHMASLRDITEHNQTKEELGKSMERLHTTMRGAIQAIAATVEMRDPYTAGHQERVADLSQAIAEELGFPQERAEVVHIVAVIHDIGKIAVPAEILVKPDQLSKLELELIKPHAEIGYNILSPIEFPWPIAQIILQHHERMDGSGYPLGLSGDEILMEARILGVADTVEAMASDRPYRPAQGIEEALEEIRKNRGVLYDPAVVDACLKLFIKKGFKFNKR